MPKVYSDAFVRDRGSYVLNVKSAFAWPDDWCDDPDVDHSYVIPREVVGESLTLEVATLDDLVDDEFHEWNLLG
jgi:hypothetical protein